MTSGSSTIATEFFADANVAAVAEKLIAGKVSDAVAELAGLLATSCGGPLLGAVGKGAVTFIAGLIADDAITRVQKEEARLDADEERAALVARHLASTLAALHGHQLAELERLLQATRRTDDLITRLGEDGREQFVQLVRIQRDNGVLIESLAGRLEQLVRELEEERERIPESPRRARGRLHGVPPLPAQYLARTEFQYLRTQLLSSGSTPLVIAGQPVSALHGMAGVGKTTLAVALARDTSVLGAFPDGVFWYTLGQTPEPAVILLNRLISGVRGERSTFTSQAEAQAYAQELLEARSCLLILDDAWDLRHVEPFRVLGPLSKLLLTTRKAAISRVLDANTTQLSELPVEEAVELLARYAGIDRTSLPREAEGLARACGELPLALAMVGSQLRGRPPDRWATMRERLERADISRLHTALPGYPHRSLLAALAVSAEDLSSGHRSRYFDLAVFPEDAAIPDATLATYWGVDRAEAQDTMDAFVDRALAALDASGRLTLHDLQHDFVRASAPDPTPLHQLLVSAYRHAGGGELCCAPNDGYAYDHLACHLRQAEGADALQRLLFDLRWLRARLENADVNRLLRDFELDPCPVTDILATGLRQASHVLNQKSEAWNGPALVSAQILGRLQHRTEPQIRQLCEQARTTIREQCAFEPVTASLRASAALEITLANQDPIAALAMLGDGRLASASGERMIKLWNLQTGACEATLEGHTSFVTALVVLHDGRIASASRDRTIKLWNARTGACEATLEGHSDSIAALAMLGDRRLASSSYDHTIKLWNLQARACERTLEELTPIAKLAFLSDGRLASASRDNVIKLWNPQTGACVGTLEGHAGPVTALVMLDDGRLASGSLDRTVNVWNTRTRASETVLEGHTGPVGALAALQNGRLASGSDDHTIKLWSPSTGANEVILEKHTASVNLLAVLSDGRFASASSDQTVKVWNPETGACEATYYGDVGRITALAGLRDRRIAVASTRDVALWNPQTGASEVMLEGHMDAHTAVAVLSDGRVACSSDSTIKLWNLQTGTCDFVFEGHTDVITALAVVGNVRLASCTESGTVKLWDPDTATCETMLLGGPAYRFRRERALAMLGEDWLAESSYDEVIKLWNLRTRACEAALEGHGDAVTALTALGDGLLASSSWDNTIVLWAVQRAIAKSAAVFVVDAAVHCAAWDGNSRVLAVGDRGGRIHFLRLHNPVQVGSKADV